MLFGLARRHLNYALRQRDARLAIAWIWVISMTPHLGDCLKKYCLAQVNEQQSA